MKYYIENLRVSLLFLGPVGWFRTTDYITKDSSHSLYLHVSKKRVRRKEPRTQAVENDKLARNDY